MQKITDIERYLDKIGPKGSISRLKEIARLELGLRSEAARRVIESRNKTIKMKSA